MPEPAIIDTTIIQVKSTTKDTYGNLIVSPVEGENIKISEKRRPLFDIFQQGNTVKLFWAEYMHKKYVVRAEVEQESPQKSSLASTEKPQKPEILQMSKEDWAEKDKTTRKSIERQKSLEMAIEVCKLSGITTEITENAIATAKRFEAYLESKEVQPAKSRLVEQAKQKLGAVEIKKGEE